MILSKVLTAAHCIDKSYRRFWVKHANKTYFYDMLPNQFYPTLASRYAVYLGAHNITAALAMSDKASSSRVVVRVRAVYIQVHPEYNLDGRKLNDIAVIKLEREVELNDYVQLACLPDPKQSGYPTRAGVEAYAIGWGSLDAESESMPQVLQNVALELLDSKTQCFVADDDQDGQHALFDWNLQVCAGRLEGGKDTCQGIPFL